jgi:hypothetical protein
MTHEGSALAMQWPSFSDARVNLVALLTRDVKVRFPASISVELPDCVKRDHAFIRHIGGYAIVARWQIDTDTPAIWYDVSSFNWSAQIQVKLVCRRIFNRPTWVLPDAERTLRRLRQFLVATTGDSVDGRANIVTRGRGADRSSGTGRFVRQARVPGHILDDLSPRSHESGKEMSGIKICSVVSCYPYDFSYRFEHKSRSQILICQAVASYTFDFPKIWREPPPQGSCNSLPQSVYPLSSGVGLSG